MVSVDLAEYSSCSCFGYPIDITFTGYRSDNSIVTQAFTIDGVIDGSGPLQDFQRFYFGLQFTNLYRVDVSPNGFSMDNVMMDVAGTNILPNVSLVQPTNGAMFVPGQTIRFAVDATDPDGDVRTV